MRQANGANLTSNEEYLKKTALISSLCIDCCNQPWPSYTQVQKCPIVRFLFDQMNSPIFNSEFSSDLFL